MHRASAVNRNKLNFTKLSSKIFLKQFYPVDYLLSIYSVHVIIRFSAVKIDQSLHFASIPLFALITEQFPFLVNESRQANCEPP